MGKKKKSKSKLRRWVNRILGLGLASLVLIIGWNYLKPMLAEGTEAMYESYTVNSGNIETFMSFSASINLVNSETFSAGTSTTVREIFVDESQLVANGDKLIQLANGEIYYANFDGMVNEIRVSQGDWVRPNGTLLQVCDIDKLQMSMSVDEYDISKLAVGQKCTVTVMSLGLSFETKLAHISRVSSSNGSVAYYTVTAEIDAPDNVLPGMQATVTIPKESVTDTLIISMSAIGFTGDNTPYVLLPNAENGYDQQEIELGLNDGMNVQVVSGLSLGDTVWAVSGTVEITPAFSLESLYKRVVGETIVINNKSSNQRGSGGQRSIDLASLQNFTPGEMPEGLENFTPGEMPEGMENFIPGEVPTTDETTTPIQQTDEATIDEAAASPLMEEPSDTVKGMPTRDDSGTQQTNGGNGNE